VPPCLAGILLVLSFSNLVGCAGAQPSAPKPGTGRTMEDIDLGSDWIESTSQARTADALTNVSRGDGVHWSVVLRTFTDELDRERFAANFMRDIVRIDPRFSSATAHTTPRGTKVTYGRYASVDDDAAQRDLKWIKDIRVGQRQVFPLAMLARIDPRAGRGAYLPHELLSARVRWPNVDPLYTLQIGAWGDFDGSGASLASIQRGAEQQVQELRARGLEAYVLHDDDRRISLVTIGTFDRTAVDAQSGIELDPILTKLRREFPVMLANGKPVTRSGGGAQGLKPTLIEVPML